MNYPYEIIVKEPDAEVHIKTRTKRLRGSLHFALYDALIYDPRKRYVGEDRLRYDIPLFVRVDETLAGTLQDYEDRYSGSNSTDFNVELEKTDEDYQLNEREIGAIVGMLEELHYDEAYDVLFISRGNVDETTLAPVETWLKKHAKRHRIIHQKDDLGDMLRIVFWVFGPKEIMKFIRYDDQTTQDD